MSNAMGLTIPTPQITAGPEYATEVSNDLEIIASHTHTGAANNDGYQIPTAGININDDLSFQSNNAISLRSTRFVDQAFTLSGIGDIGCVYEKSGDLWYNNSAGIPVQITSGSSVITTTGGYEVTEITTNLVINPALSYILISCDSTSNTITITLPLASDVPTGRFYIIKDRTGKASLHNITVALNGTDTIDLVAPTPGNYVIRNKFDGICLVSDGISNWFLLRYANPSTPIATTSASIVITANVTEDLIYILDVSSNNISVGLPPLSSTKEGLKITIKDSGSASPTGFKITVSPNGANLIEGLNAVKSIITPFGELNLICSSAGWYMV